MTSQRTHSLGDSSSDSVAAATGGWWETTLGEAGVELQHGYTFPSGDLSPDGGLPVVRIGNVQRGQIVIDDAVRYSGNVSSESLSKQLVSYGDLLIALTGGDESNLNTSTGRIGRYNIKTPALLNQRVAKVLPSGQTDPDFLFYLLLQPSITRYLAATANGSVQRNLTNGHILGLEVSLPSLAEQCSIAAVLSSLDDKIDLLRRQNETLEQIAQLIFKEWFVKPTADGVLPEGWKLGTLGEIAEIDWGNTNLTKSSYSPTGQYLGVSAAGGDGRIAHAEHPVGTSVISAIGEYAGRMFYPHEPFTAIKNTLTVSPIEGVSTPGYIHNLLAQHTLPRRGAAQPFLSKGDTEEYEVVVPPLSEILRAESLFSVLDEKVRENLVSIQTLVRTRDSLLPQLMSGEVRVGISG